MTTSSNTLHIDPLKFTIHDFDLSDCSDSDIDDDDWINISSSSTTSTTSTLPSYLVLRPNAQHSGQMDRRGGSNAISGGSHSGNITTSKPVSDPSLMAHVSRAASQQTTSSPIPSSRTQSVVKTLKSHIPTLTAIYLTSPSSVTSPSPYPPTTPRSDSILPPFPRTLSSPSPLRLSNFLPYHKRPPFTKSPRLRHPTETYLRICTACFLPQYRSILISCDGTWADVTSADTTTISNVCKVHASTFGGTTLQQWLKNHDIANDTLATEKSLQDWTDSSRDTNTTTKAHSRCTHGPRAACPECPVPIVSPPTPNVTLTHRGSSKDFLAALIEAVSPFNRDETERDGIRVFDMRSPGSGEGNGLVYVHKEGCGCGR
ncbi:hypothetical protein PMZ80_010208 [Knufia obscura]|uniref:Uncharacterized protein n=1 Tax=Knufia obscura TaxID=1635080 RepID=A0ABR0RAE3_9EURO|nr:hypothetical protein PMZ80_010208 [Knufia obscura]